MELTNNLANNELNWQDEKIPDVKPRKKLNIKARIKADPAKLDAFRYVEKNTKDGLKKSWIYHNIVSLDTQRNALLRLRETATEAFEAYCPNCLSELGHLITVQKADASNAWMPYVFNIDKCPVCGQSLCSHIHECMSHEPYVTAGVNVIGDKIQIWIRLSSIRMAIKRGGIIASKIVKILTVNTKTRQTYLTIIDGKKKQVRKVLRQDLRTLLYETDCQEKIQGIVSEQFKALTGMELVNANDIALVNLTRENVSWNNCKSIYYNLKDVMKEVDRSLFHFDDNKQKLAKALFPHVKENITIIAYASLLPDNQRKLFDACHNRSFLSKEMSWEYDVYDNVEREELREQLYLNALYMVKFVNSNETVAVNRIIKWVNTDVTPQKLTELFRDTIRAFIEIEMKKGNVSDCVAKTLKETHDNAWRLNAKLRVPEQKIEYTKEEMVYQQTVDDIQFCIPKSTHSLIDVGENMHICVGGYGHEAVNKHCTIVVGYKNNKEEVCIELIGKDIHQAKLFGNELPSGETRTTVLKWAKLCKLKLNTYDLMQVDEETGEVLNMDELNF